MLFTRVSFLIGEFYLGSYWSDYIFALHFLIGYGAIAVFLFSAIEVAVSGLFLLLENNSLYVNKTHSEAWTLFQFFIHQWRCQSGYL